MRSHFALLGLCVALASTMGYAQSPGGPTQAEAEQSPSPSSKPPHHEEPDNGTDPTRVRRSLTIDFEHNDLRNGFTLDQFEVDFSQPLASHTSITATAWLPSVDTLGDKSIGFGDIELVLTHIPVVTRKHGIVVKGGIVLDTASRPELGNGQTVLEATFIYAWFLKGGHIFAPSFEQDYGINRDKGRDRVNNLTIDFYYVPHLKDRNYYMTVDPFIVLDWEGDKHSGGLSVTLGRIIGPALGGRLQGYIKPSVFVGQDRGANWGFETGLKLLNF